MAMIFEPYYTCDCGITSDASFICHLLKCRLLSVVLGLTFTVYVNDPISEEAVKRLMEDGEDNKKRHKGRYIWLSECHKRN